MDHPRPDVLVVGDANPDLVLTGDVVPRFGQEEQLLERADLSARTPPSVRASPSCSTSTATGPS
jgi:ribokinase